MSPGRTDTVSEPIAARSARGLGARGRPALGSGMPAPAVLAAGFLAGSVPFSNIAARRLRRVDLRHVGSGTVSGTSLYRVAGFGPLAVFGICDVAKGAIGPLLAGRDRPYLAAAAGGAAVVGHNWSPWLCGAGGRGISPAIGALLPRHWQGSALLLGGMAAGRLSGETALGSALVDALLIPVLSHTHGRSGRLAAAGVVMPMVLKRLMGNQRPRDAGWQVYVRRVLLDRDTAPPPDRPVRLAQRVRRGVRPGESGPTRSAILVRDDNAHAGMSQNR